jgi:hypothetical protein
MFLALCVVQIALLLYGRNVVAASAHEGARAALELGRNPNEAAVIATETIEQSTGRLLDRVSVDVGVQTIGRRSIVVVNVSGRLSYPGPLPFSPTVSARASAAKETPLR